MAIGRGATASAARRGAASASRSAAASGILRAALLSWATYLARDVSPVSTTPIYVTHRQKFMVSHAWFGSRKFDRRYRGRELVWPFVTMRSCCSCPRWGSPGSGSRRQNATSPRAIPALARRAFTRRSRVVRAGLAADHQRRGALVLTLGLAWSRILRPPLHFTNRSNLTLVGLSPGPATIRQTRAPPATGGSAVRAARR